MTMLKERLDMRNLSVHFRHITAQGVGRILWEAWTTNPSSATFNCPGIAGWSDPPAAGWYLHDRRCLTQIEADSGGLTGNLFAWPGVGLKDLPGRSPAGDQLTGTSGLRV